MNIEQTLAVMTPDIYERFKEAVAIRKWPDGRVLTQEQVETCLQAIIAYEARNLPQGSRTGEVPPKNSDCDHLNGGNNPNGEESPLKWQ